MKRLTATADECAGIARCARGVDMVAKAADSFENTLLTNFDEACAEDDRAKARRIATILFSWNGARGCIQHYLAKVDIFSNEEFLPPNKYVDETYFADRQQRILAACRREKERIVAIFPNAEVVLAQLGERVFEMCIAPLVVRFFVLVFFSVCVPFFPYYRFFASPCSLLSCGLFVCLFVFLFE